jgi:hypothetical protein
MGVSLRAAHLSDWGHGLQQSGWGAIPLNAAHSNSCMVTPRDSSRIRYLFAENRLRQMRTAWLWTCAPSIDRFSTKRQDKIPTSHSFCLHLETLRFVEGGA